MLRIEAIPPGNKLSIDPRESAFSHGEGLFESIHVSQGQLQFWSRHWARFKVSAFELFSYDLSEIDESDCLDAVKEYYRKLGKTDFVLKLSLVFLATEPVLYIYSREHYIKDASAKLFLNMTQPINQNAFYIGHKTHNYFENIWLLKKAKQAGYTDYLRVNTKGAVCETCVGNCFFYQGDKLVTASRKSGLFPGVIRDILLESLPIVEKEILINDLSLVDASFMTNSVVGILPIIEISGLPNGSSISFSDKLHPQIKEARSILKTIAKLESINLD